MPKLVDSDRAVVQAAKKANKQKEKANRREKRVPHLGDLLCFVCLWLCWRLYVCAGLSVSGWLDCGCAVMWLHCWSVGLFLAASLVVSVKWQLYGDTLFYFLPRRAALTSSYLRML
jgi:hypothetical protein